MMENPFFLAVGTIMVALLVAARFLPNQKWLDPFRVMRLPEPAPRQDEASASLATARADRPAATAPTHIEMRLAERQRSFRRFSRIHAGFTIMVAGVVILFGTTLCRR